ncbi:MAG: methyltransferase domain-containing protein, partial [Spirochaetaceae bacterium]|nr:methyltransferase domain-containing protein [Spirochaetaceae bacterium]
VICVDLQRTMLGALLRRARRANLDDRIETRLCGPDSLGVSDLAGQIDFALAFAVVHEVADPIRLFAEIHTVLKPGGRVLVAEPKGRVTEPSFQESIATAEEKGFHPVASPHILRSYAVVLERSKDANQALHGD